MARPKRAGVSNTDLALSIGHPIFVTVLRANRGPMDVHLGAATRHLSGSVLALCGCPGACSCAKRTTSSDDVAPNPQRAARNTFAVRVTAGRVCHPGPSSKVRSCIILMEYGDIPNRMTRAAAAGDKSPCQAVRPPTGRVSGSHPYLQGRIHGFKAESQSSLLRSVSQANTPFS